MTASQDRERGFALFAAGRDWEASRMLARVRAAGAGDAETLRKLGWARFATGDAAGAEAAMREALASASDDWVSHYALGVVLRGRDDRTAMSALAAALRLAPGNVECLLALSSCALNQHDAAAAEGYARSALAAETSRRGARMALAVALLAGERTQEALDAFTESEHLSEVADGERAPNLDRGLALRLLGRTQEAIEYYETKLPEVPDVVAHGQYALALLTAGDFRRGWEQYAFRWFDASLAAQRAAYNRPQWRGQDLRGRTILLRCEQGVGDVLQFVRYAQLVKDLGATVLLELRPGLGALTSAFRGIDAAFEHGEVTRDFDYWSDLLSLPLAFGSGLDTVPADVPYLYVDDARRARWHDRMRDRSGPRIGIVWAGDPRHLRDRQRSIPLDMLRPLFGIPGVSWFSLQKGPAVAALNTAGLDGAVIDLDRELGNYADTAAAIDALDLIIAVDTSIAHLAGALGKAVWVLLPTPADWRWLEDRDDTPWYPTMRLFRQRRAGDWPEVVARVAAAIEAGRDLPRGAGAGSSDTVTPTTREESAPSNVRGTRAEAHPADLARACYTRVGWMQCAPSAGPLAVSLEYYGEHLQAEVDLLARLVGRNSVIVEFGAGLGYHAIALAPLAGDDGQVIAVETSPVLRTILRQNIASCGAAGVSVLPGSAADTPIDVLDFERLDLLTINDTVRAERLVAAAATTLWRLRPNVFAANLPRQTLDALAGHMVDFGYRSWSVDTALFDQSNFNRRGDDVFGGARVLSLLAIPEERNFDPPSDLPTRILAVNA